jgi:hypothetical protein
MDRTENIVHLLLFTLLHAVIGADPKENTIPLLLFAGRCVVTVFV